MKQEDFKKRLFPLNIQFFADGDSTGSKDAEDKKKEDEEVAAKKKREEEDKETGRKAVSEYLRGLGIETDEDLSSIVKKHKEDEEKNKTDLEKVQSELAKTLKLLNAEKEAHNLVAAQLEALKLGAKTELVEDLVLVAMARVTKDKDIKAVIAEIKEGNTGSVYFGDDSDDQESQGRTVTGGDLSKSGKKEDKKKETGAKGKGVASRLLEKKQETKKSSFW